MAGGRKRKADEASSPTGNNSPGQPAAAAPPLPREAPAAWSAPSWRPVHTGETMVYDVAHRLRSGRKVLVLNTDKPGPPPFNKGRKRVDDISWHTPACAKAALKHYNKFNEDEHELVKAVDSIAFFFNGQWMHANFLAKSKGGTSCADLVPKYFFAELKTDPHRGMKKLKCVSCIKMDPGNPRTAPVRGCRICPSRIFHPVAGMHIGGRRDAAGGVETKAASLSNADSTAQIKSAPVEQPPAEQAEAVAEPSTDLTTT
ncbi:unnamed protein product [Urochloa humidicola]